MSLRRGVHHIPRYTLTHACDVLTDTPKYCFCFRNSQILMRNFIVPENSHFYRVHFFLLLILFFDLICAEFELQNIFAFSPYKFLKHIAFIFAKATPFFPTLSFFASVVYNFLTFLRSFSHAFYFLYFSLRNPPCQFSHWSRKDKSVVLKAALLPHFASFPSCSPFLLELRDIYTHTFPGEVSRFYKRGKRCISHIYAKYTFFLSHSTHIHASFYSVWNEEREKNRRKLRTEQKC